MGALATFLLTVVGFWLVFVLPVSLVVGWWFHGDWGSVVRGVGVLVAALLGVSAAWDFLRDARPRLGHPGVPRF